MKVKVTQDDIDKGRTMVRDTCGCPIHRALARLLGVGEDEGLFVENIEGASWGRVLIPLPPIAVKFQEKLWNRRNARVDPFEFETHLVEPVEPVDSDA